MSEPTLAAESEGYRFKLEAFEGPLDLLLHLVRVNEVDIADIPIVEITRQYNGYLALMRHLNLEVVGEYLVMAATLMHIKSRMLLPPEPDGGPTEEAVDPRTELARQLLDYQRFKQAAESLGALESRRSLIWTRQEVPLEFGGEELLVVDLFDLLRAFRGLMARIGEEAELQLKRDSFSVAERIAWLEALLLERAEFGLLELLEGLSGRLERIATFLAILELIRQRRIGAYQRRLFEEIRIVRREAPGVEP